MSVSFPIDSMVYINLICSLYGRGQGVWSYINKCNFSNFCRRNKCDKSFEWDEIDNSKYE